MTRTSAPRHNPADITVPKNGVRVIESHHSPRFAMDFGRWPFQKICWVAIGRGRLEYEGGTCEISKDDFLILPADWMHRFVDEPGSPLALVILCISTGFIGIHGEKQRWIYWRRALEHHPPGQSLSAQTAFHKTTLIHLFRKALHEQDAQLPGWNIALQTIADEFLLCLARSYFKTGTDQQTSAADTIRGVIEHINAHPNESFQIDAIADRCGMSPRRFTGLFKNISGETFNTYVTRKRIQYACERLRETGHILYACHEAGFNDPSYFYRVFKKQTGLTPGEFLKNPHTVPPPP